MSESFEVRLPDIGDFDAVEVIEVLVEPGAVVEPEDALITLESDKATMDIPAPHAGTVREVKVAVGDQVAEGALIVVLDLSVTALASSATGAGAPAATPSPTSTTAQAPLTAEADLTAEVLVLGSGPGGYTAAFRAADLGKQVILVERYAELGGVCLNVGCIPSKALLHAAKVIAETKEMAEHGIQFGDPTINVDKLRNWKQGIVGQLTKGLSGLARQRHVKVVQGFGQFVAPNQLVVDSGSGRQTIAFEQAIIAAGSHATQIPSFPNTDPRLLDSTSALALDAIPDRMLVIGGGIIGLEMACVYAELGARITVVELLDTLMPGTDPDLVKPLQKRISKQYEAILLGTQVTAIQPSDAGLEVSFDGKGAPAKATFDRVLVAVGRRPNGTAIAAEAAGVFVDASGFIPVDNQQRTNVPHIFAIGDIVGQPMLAHKAVHEGKVAAEVSAGEKSGFDASVIPSVAYTDPEVAWVGVTEAEAKQNNIEYGKGVFPWAASGRSLSLGRNEGLTKLLFEPGGRVIGAGIVGPQAGDLIAEVALAIEMGCDATDIAMTIHPHPTLSETVAMAAEAFEGTITDLYMPKK